MSINPLTGSLRVAYTDYDGNTPTVPFGRRRRGLARARSARRKLEEASSPSADNSPTLYVSRLRERYEGAPEPLRVRLRSLARKRGLDLRPPPNAQFSRRSPRQGRGIGP